MPPTYSRSSRPLGRPRTQGKETPTVNGNHSNHDGDASTSRKSNRRVIRLKTTRSAAATPQDDEAGTSTSSVNRKKKRKKESEEVGSQDTKEEEANAEKKLYERWAEEYYEIVEQLPLELHRTFALMRELESKMQNRIAFVASQTKIYRDARLQKEDEEEQQQEESVQSMTEDYLQLEYGPSSDRDAEGEDEETFHDVVESSNQVESAVQDVSPATKPDMATPRAARQSILRNIAKASSDAIRAAEEKVGLAVTAYDWVDRHIRRLDGDLQRSESSLLLGLRAGTEASRGVRDALGIGDGDNNKYGNTVGGAAWQEDSIMSGQSTPMLNTRKKGQKGGNKLADDLIDSNSGAISGSLMTDMAIDPNEPKYCYCDQVSSGDMVACDNEDCPREWFHYHCVGFTAPPKGKWYCLFCALPGFKGSGTFPTNAPCLPPSYGKKQRGEEVGSVPLKKSNSKRKN